MMNERRLDLVLINPGNRTQVYQSLGRTLAAIEPPIWAGLMAAFAQNHGLSVEILDAEAEGLTAEQAAVRVEEMNPVLVTIVVYGHQPSASTQNMPAALSASEAIKNRCPNQRLLLVGGHVAALPERTLHESAADFVAGGEALLSIVELVNALKTEHPDVQKVQGLWYRDGAITRSNKPAPLITALDRSLPGIPWDLLPMERYRAHNWHCFGGLKRQPYAAFYTTLGCPYHCEFCCIQAPFKEGERVAGYKPSVNSYRYWNPEFVVGQIDTLVQRYGVRNIKIADEMFVLNPGHVGKICDLIIDRGYDLNIWAYARVDTVRDDMVDKLKRAGFNWLAFGIEAASERVRDGVKKGFDQADVFSTIGKVRSAGINVIGNYIFGLPEDDLSTMQATLDLALELNCEFANFYSTMAYPGSPLYESAQRSAWALPDTWAGYSQHSIDTLPLPTKHLSAGDVLKFRDWAFQQYFSSSAYLKMIQSRFGTDTVDHIRQMASHGLKRKYVQG